MSLPTYKGRFFQLRGATLLPRPQRPGGPPIMIGGNGIKRTLPLVARYADIWNAVFLTPDAFRQHSAILDELLRAMGRKPGDVRRTMMSGVFLGRTMDELDRRLSWRHQEAALADKPLEVVVETLHASRGILVGTPDIVVRQIKAHADAGVDELVLQWFDPDDLEGLRALAASVLPHL